MSDYLMTRLTHRTFLPHTLAVLLLGTVLPLRAGVELSRNFENSRIPARIADGPGLSLQNNDVAPASPGDQDLGEQWLLKFKEKERPFVLMADFAGYATNNVSLVERGTYRDQFLVGQAAVSYQPKITESLLAEFTFRQAFFRYRRFTELDFDSQNMGSGLTYVAPRLWNVAFYGRYNYNRILDAREQNEVFTSHTFTMGLQKSLILSRAHYFYAGYASQLGISHPVSAERNEHGAYAGYHVNLTRSLQADLYYRAALFDYSEGRRRDWNQTASSSLQYYFTKWLYGYGSASFATNDSNRLGLGYDAFTAALGLNATVKF